MNSEAFSERVMRALILGGMTTPMQVNTEIGDSETVTTTIVFKQSKWMDEALRRSMERGDE